MSEGQDIPVDFGRADCLTRFSMGFDSSGGTLQFVLNAQESIAKIAEEGLFGQTPATLVCAEELPLCCWFMTLSSIVDKGEIGGPAGVGHDQTPAGPCAGELGEVTTRRLRSSRV
jgi:hypothetical protein